MAVRHYSTDELLALRNSPLVAKPDGLPSIEQWLEFVYMESDGVREKLRIPHSESANTGDQRQQTHGAVSKEGGKRDRRLHGANPTVPEASPMGAFSTGRPTLGTRNSTVRGAAGDDIALGPPKTVFASSRHNSRLADSAGEAASADDADNSRAKFFSDRQLNRRSGVQEKDGRDNRDSWTRAAERRALGGDDEGKADKNDRYGRHDTSDRNGYGDKADPRWNNNRGEERRPNGDRPAGGWREREQARRNNGDRHDEREPEWMEDPVVKKDQELNFAQARTAEEFQKWKESMSKKVKGEAEVEKEVVEAAPPPPERKSSLTLDGFEPGGFFAFNAPSGAPTPGSTATTPASGGLAKPSGKGKTSRFASMFKPPVEETPPPPPESDMQKAANGFAKTTAEDQAGFNRVLQMLGGGLKIGGQPTPPSESPAPPAPQSPPQSTKAGANGGTGAKPKSRFFQPQSKGPEPVKSPQQGGVQLGGDHHFDREETATRPAQEPTMTPEPSNMYNALREQQPRPSSGRVSELAIFDPPSRGAPSPDINIQNLLAQQRQRPQHHSHESQNLLNLLKKGDVAQQLSRPPSQQTSGGDSAQLQSWLDHQHQANSHGGAGPNIETYAPRPARIPQQPPGLFEEQLMRNFPSREDLGRDQQQMPPGIPDPRRQQQQQQQQRAPPGFYDEREMMMQQQQQQQQQLLQQQQMRRNYAEAPPPQQMPPQPQQFRKPQAPPQQYQGEYHITSPNLSGPPPGFNAAPPPHHMPRHPPGFGGPPQQQHFQQQREAPPPGTMPPGFGPQNGGGPPPGTMPPGFGPQNGGGPPPGTMPPGFGPQNGGGPPPGFYGAGPPPPGFQNVRGSMDGIGMPPPPPGMRGRPSAGYDGYENGRRG